MTQTIAETRTRTKAGANVVPAADSVSDELKRHFRNYFAVFLDGALNQPGGLEGASAQARRILAGFGTTIGGGQKAELADVLGSITPNSRPETGAGLVPVGPRAMRVWWDRSLMGGVEDVLADLSRPRAVMRFYDVTDIDPASGAWNHMFDIDVALSEDGRTVDFWSADRTYVVDVGVVYADGRFLPLTRTNCAALPREGCGNRDFAVVRARLADEVARLAFALVPDAAVRAWADGREDRPERDYDAEMAVRMIYTAFLNEGPRALRKLPRLKRRATYVLEREYAFRQAHLPRASRIAERTKSVVAPRVLVERLDAPAAVRRAALTYPPILAAKPLSGLIGDHGFVVYNTALALARHSHPVISSVARTRTGTDLSSSHAPATRPLGTVRTLPAASGGTPTPDRSASLRRMAACLRQTLEALPDVKRGTANPPADPAPHANIPVLRLGASAADAGGTAGRALADSGVTISRMALVLEGRARPGAKFRIAGEMVETGADGFFSVECELSGGKLQIPVQADSEHSAARAAINVEWTKESEKGKFFVG